MKLPRTTIGTMISLRELIKEDRPNAEALIHEFLDRRLVWLERIKKEQPFDKSSRISRGLRLARMRYEVKQWEKLCDELNVPVLCERATP